LPKLSKNIYSQIDNDNDIITAHNFLKTSKQCYNKYPIDNYRIGNIYDFMLHDTKNAKKYYKKALKQINSNRYKNLNESVYIHDRIIDRLQLNNFMEQDDNKLNENEVQHINNSLNAIQSLQNTNTNTIKRKKNNTDLKNKIVWVGDTQNVHDTLINNQVSKNFNKIQNYNKKNQIYIWDFDSIQQYIRSCSNEINPLDIGNIPDAVKMLDIINKKNVIVSKTQKPLKYMTKHVFSYIMSQPSPKRKIMIENFIMNLKDSYKNGTPLCITGQTTRIMSSVVFEEENKNNLDIKIKSFSSKPVIKNDIIYKSSQIRDKIYNSYSEDIRKKYDELIDCNEVNEMEEKMKISIKEMVNKEYPDIYKTDKKWIDKVLNEVYQGL